MTAGETRTPASDPPPPPHADRNPLTPRKVRSFGTSARRRRKVRASLAGGRSRSGPVTPLLRWKCDGVEGICSVDGPSEKVDGSVSARKLAAALRRVQVQDVGEVASGRRSIVRDRAELAYGHLNMHFSHSNSPFLRPNTASDLKNGVEHRIIYHDSSIEKATKWDPGTSKTPDSVYQIYDQLKLVEDQKISSAFIVPTLQAELEHARACIHELETERQNAKKKMEHFLKKIAEEKAAWRSREHEKVRAIIGDVKDDLNRERKNRQRLEISNSRLVNELAEAKITTKRMLQDYQKERKARELIEEVCEDLAKEISEDKAELEALKKESTRVREEVEEEKKMLQMAEVWREERVQMKLVDAKVTLEDKFSHMSKLIAGLEEFLKSRSTTINMADTREAELLRKAAECVQIQDIKEFSYKRPTSDDLFAVFEDLRSGDANNQDVDASLTCSPVSSVSKMHTVSPGVNGFHKKCFSRQPKGRMNACVNVDEDDSGWETVSQVEEQGSTNSADQTYLSINDRHEESIPSASGTEWEENTDNETVATETSEAHLASMKQDRKKISALYKLWRSGTHNGQKCKKISGEVTNEKHSNGRISNGLASMDGRSGEMGVSISAASLNDCVEQPRGLQKPSLKSKLLEARIGGHKVQLRQVLKNQL